ncbi:MAG: FtsQ-type POTRA domain-containing protein [Fibrobacter sp.]|jgi:cell division protein FtsQ|nr:FtsQ-type POTRA domain-containing protein [Fibrobacter sp.]
MNRDTTKIRKRQGYNASQKKERRQKRRKESLGAGIRLFRNVGWKVLLILVVVGALAWLARPWLYELRHWSPSELRNLKKIEISGNQMLIWDDIVNASGVELGMPMSAIQTDSITSRLSKLPLIQKAEVKESFPYTLVISVTESGPLFTRLSGDGWKVYSEKATVMPMSISSAYQLPVVSAPETELKSIAEFLAGLKTLDPAHYREISQVVSDRVLSGIEVIYRDTDYKTLFPPGNPGAEMLENYRKLTEGLSEELADVSVIDMRFPGFAYTKPFEKRHNDG